MEILESLNHLNSNYQYRLKREVLLAKIEQLLQIGPKDRHNQYGVVTFDAKPVDCRDSICQQLTTRFNIRRYYEDEAHLRLPCRI